MTEVLQVELKPGERLRIKQPGLYKMRQRMSKKAGKYLTINECWDQIECDIAPELW